MSKVSPFGPQEGLSMMNPAGIGTRLLLASQIRKQNGALPVSLIAAQAAERANLNNPHANGRHGKHEHRFGTSTVARSNAFRPFRRCSEGLFGRAVPLKDYRAVNGS